MSDETDGLRKCAILLASLESEQAEDVLRRLDPEEARRLSSAMLEIDRVGGHVLESVLKEFCLAAQLPPQELIDSDIPFSALQDQDNNSLLSLIHDEHPQTIALVLAYLPSEKAGDLLGVLPGQMQFEVVKRLAGIEQTSSDVIAEVERRLEQRIGRIVSLASRAGGAASSEIAKVLDRAAKGEAEIVEGVIEEERSYEDEGSVA